MAEEDKIQAIVSDSSVDKILYTYVYKVYKEPSLIVLSTNSKSKSEFVPFLNEMSASVVLY